MCTFRQALAGTLMMQSILSAGNLPSDQLWLKFTKECAASRAALVQTSNIATTDAVMTDQQITN